MSILTAPVSGKRKFLPEEFKLTVWSRLKPYFSELLYRELHSFQDWENWLYDWKEVHDFVQVEIKDRRRQMNKVKDDEMAKAYFQYAQESIRPKVLQYSTQLEQRLESSSFSKKLKSLFKKLF